MKKRVMIMAICALIAMGGGGVPLSGQTKTTYTPFDPLKSNTNVATAGIFKNDVDNFIDYHKYSTVLKDDAKWFGFLTGRNEALGVLDAGYARNFGGIYLGVWYRGNIYRSDNVDYETKTIQPTYDDVLEILTQREDTTTYNKAYNETTNNIEFLIGVAGMGIKVGFFESTSSNKNAGIEPLTVTDYLDGRKDYVNVVDKYQDSRSTLKPYLGWGGTFAVADMSLRPYVDISFSIYDNTEINKVMSYTEVNGEKQNIKKENKGGSNEGTYTPYGKVGAWLDLAKKDTVQQSIGLSYAFSMLLQSSDAEGLGNVAGSVGWWSEGNNGETVYSDRTETETNMGYYISEITDISHQITPAYKITGEPGENFKLGFSASVPVSFSSWSKNPYLKHKSKVVTKYNNGLPGSVYEKETIEYPASNAWDLRTERSELGIDLKLALGASYQLIPNRFGLNAGISASPLGYYQKVEKNIARTTKSIETEKTTEDDGTVTQNDKTVVINVPAEKDDATVTSGWSQYTATLRGGFTFYFNDNAALDMAITSTSSDANKFDLDLTTVNVIFTFKY